MREQLVSCEFKFSDAITASGADGVIPTSFTGEAYSGGVASSWMGKSAIDLSSVQEPKKSMFSLVNHDENQRAGHCAIKNTGSSILIDGKFFTNDHGSRVAKEFSEGAPWDFSVGFDAVATFFDHPTEITVNGQQLILDVLFTKARVTEVSFVVAGADPNTTAIAFSKKGKDTMPDAATITELNRTIQVEMAAKNTAIAELSAVKAERDEVKAKFAAVTDSLTEATTALADMTIQFNAAKAKMAEMREASRKSEIKALFSAIGREFSDDSAKPYMDMSGEQFEFIASELKSIHSKYSAHPDGRDSSLFKEQANGNTVDNAAKLKAMAEKYRADNPAVTYQQALSAVLQANPHLYSA